MQAWCAGVRVSPRIALIRPSPSIGTIVGFTRLLYVSCRELLELAPRLPCLAGGCIDLPDAPIAHDGFFVTHFLTVRDQAKSRDFYVGDRVNSFLNLRVALYGVRRSLTFFFANGV